MSYCVSHGKDKVMFLTKEDLKGPSSIVLPESDEPRGLLLPNGEINWGCPCPGDATLSPCWWSSRALPLSGSSTRAVTLK
ncbi:hypothetical protein AVEN_248404-1 [Araneus ventricosus]|uniref:Uncharacterized protein n=1 Tax=Araneus ventricosus TaxID=182803 RepID=A0A4Y2QF86_ARAVE|nr:hypothetical protein AVEN_248404-1 [Araneus ventricosus]